MVILPWPIPLPYLIDSLAIAIARLAITLALHDALLRVSIVTVARVVVSVNVVSAVASGVGALSQYTKFLRTEAST